MKHADGWIDGVKKKIAEMEESLKDSVPPILPVPKTVEEPEAKDDEQTTEPPSIGPQPESPPIRSDEVRSDSTMSYLSLNKLIDLKTLTEYVKMSVQELLNIVSVSFLVVVMVVFMLIEAAKLPEKIAAAFPDRDLSSEYLRRIGEDTWKYTKIKTLISLLTAVATAIGLWFLGVEYSILWGLLIFFLNFIPNIGPIIASVPPVLLALVDQGMFGCILVTGYLVVINWAIGYGLEPRYLGEGLGISELVVLLSLIFWGWLLGPIGMFLSAPLTMVLKIVLQNNPDTRWIAILMSNR
jgi:predicted PurR-regulated permease PerM